MSITRTHLLAAALAATALTPAAALATGASSHPELRGSPQMRMVDAHHATLNLASDRLPRTSRGEIDARITYADGSRVSGLRPSGRHGRSTTYTARVSSTGAMTNRQKFTVRFRLGGSRPVQRIVTLHMVADHG